MTDFMVIDLSADGEASAMHRDNFDLGFLGNQSIRRASEIIFDETAQKWDIHLNVPGKGFLPFEDAKGFATYDIARRVEVEWLEQSSLHSVDPASLAGISHLITARSKIQ